MSKVKVVKTTVVEETGSDWDDNEDSVYKNTYESHSIHGIQLTERYFDLDVPFDIVKDKEYYLVTVLYDTGCSFYEEKGKIEFVDLFETKEKAEQICKIIEENGEDYALQLFRENDVSYKFSCPWSGYFEYLVSVYVETVNLLQ